MATVNESDASNNSLQNPDWGEMNASTPVDSYPSPPSDLTSYPDEPWDIPPRGAVADSPENVNRLRAETPPMPSSLSEQDYGK
jgi:hypothetical protein